MQCAEFDRLLTRYCDLLQAYSGAVRQLTELDAATFAERSKEAEELRLTVRQARREWEDHEVTHGCGRKPVQKAEGVKGGQKTGS